MGLDLLVDMDTGTYESGKPAAASTSFLCDSSHFDFKHGVRIQYHRLLRWDNFDPCGTNVWLNITIQISWIIVSVSYFNNILDIISTSLIQERYTTCQ